jgi:hypothetical protein
LSTLDVETIKGDYEVVGNFIECQYTPGSSNQYIVDSLHDVININGEEHTIYEYMLRTGNIKKYLCNNDKIQTAIGYYNPYVQTLEFIFYGIKFILKLSSNEYNNEIKLNEFDNYEIFIINDYNGTNTNEIIVSKKEEFILFINHVYKSGYYYGNENIKMYKDNLMQDVTYDWYKSPFNYELIDTAYINSSIYVKKSSSYILDDIEHISSFVEEDLDIYAGEFKDFNETPNFSYFTIDSGYTCNKNHDVYDSSANAYTNIDSSILNGYDNFV